MVPVLGRFRRHIAAVAAFALLPSLAQAAVVFRGSGVQPDFRYGNIRFHPKSIVIAVNSQVGGTATFRVKQKGNPENRFKGRIDCLVQLGSPPRVDMDGKRGTIVVPPQSLLGVAVDCTVTVLGKGGVTGTMPVELDINF